LIEVHRPTVRRTVMRIDVNQKRVDGSLLS
jgi:hypothetical protein